MKKTLLLVPAALSLCACGERAPSDRESAAPLAARLGTAPARPVIDVDSEWALPYYAAALDSLDTPSRAVRVDMERMIQDGWEPADGGPQRYLAAHAAVLDAVIAGTTRACLESPSEVREAFRQPGDLGLTEWRELANLLILEGRRREHDQDLEGALECYLGVLRMAHQCRPAASASIISVLIGGTLEDQASPRIAELVREAHLPEAVWRATLEQLLALGDARVRLDVAQHNEQRELRAVVAEAFAEQCVNADALAHGMERYDSIEGEHQAAFLESWRAADPGPIVEWTQALEKDVTDVQLLEIAFDEEARLDLSVKEILHVTLPKYGTLIQMDHVHAVEMDLLATAVALRLHMDETGRPPEFLEELVPGLLPEVFADPYGDGAPIRWARTDDEWRLYSLGPDRIDQGGRDDIEWNLEEPGDVVCVVARL